MKLDDYLALSPRGTARALARVLQVSPVMLSQWSLGVKQVPPERCPALERATAGAVTCEELRPDVIWYRVPSAVWPTASGRPLWDVGLQLQARVAA